MKINISGKSIKAGEDFRKRVDQKLGKFSRYFDETAEANVKMRPEGDEVRVEVTIRIKKHIYRTETVAKDMKVAFDDAIDKLERQIRKQKTRFEKNIRDYAYMQEYLKSYTVPEEEFEQTDDGKLIKHKTFDIHPMTVDEACLQMEMLGHSFLLFLSADDDKVCLVYKRNDGNYGLIEPNY